MSENNPVWLILAFFYVLSFYIFSTTLVLTPLIFPSTTYAYSSGFDVSPVYVNCNDLGPPWCHLTFSVNPSDFVGLPSNMSAMDIGNADGHYGSIDVDPSCFYTTGTCTVTGMLYGSSLSEGASIQVYLYDRNDYGNTLITSNTTTITYNPPTTPTPTSTPTPTPSASAQIAVDPSSGNKTVGTPFTVNVTVSESNSEAFNAAQATIALEKLAVTGITYPHTNSCNFYFTKRPTTNDSSFAGAILGGSSTSCTAFSMTLSPTETGDGKVNFSDESIRAASDSDELWTGSQEGSYTISAAAATPTPTTALSQLSVTSPLLTYLTSYTLTGTYMSPITHVFVDGSESGVTLDSGNWSKSEDLSAHTGDFTFTIYGSDSTNQTATQNVVVNRHTLGDINGDGNVDLTDVSLFAVDWGKNSNLTYTLSDMSTPPDGNVDLYDLSVLAKLVE